MDPAIGSACSDTGASFTPDTGSHAEGVRGCDWYLVCAVAVSKATLSFTDCRMNFEGRVMIATSTVSAAVSGSFCCVAFADLHVFAAHLS